MKQREGHYRLQLQHHHDHARVHCVEVVQIHVRQDVHSLLAVLERIERIARLHLLHRAIRQVLSRMAPDETEGETNQQLALQHFLDVAHQNHARLSVKRAAKSHLHARKRRGVHAVLRLLLCGKHFILLYA